MVAKKSLPIQRKLFISFIFLTLTISICISLISYFVTQRIIKDRVGKSYAYTLDFIANSVEIEQNRIVNLTNYLFVNDTIKQAIQTYGSDTAEHLELDYKAYLDIKQYFLSHGLFDINSIVILGKNGYQLYYYANHDEREFFYLSEMLKDREKEMLEGNGSLVWGGLETRYLSEQLIPSQGIRLFRVIKSEDYKDTIGYMYMSLKPTMFSKYLTLYDTSYPDFAEDSSLFIYHKGELLMESQDSGVDGKVLQEVLNNPQAFSTDGLVLPGKKHVVFAKCIADSSWVIAGLLPTKFLLVDNKYIYLISISAFFLTIFACSLLWYYFSLRLFKPLRELSQTMMLISQGDKHRRVSINSADEIGQLGHNFNEMLDQNEKLFESNLKREIEIQHAQYEALMLQINPHFLNNTLNTIRWMAIMCKADNIKKVVDALWAIIKYNYQVTDKLVTIEEEVESVKKYIYLQKIAYTERFRIVWNIDYAVYGCSCPKFFLQPIVENAIQHGILPGAKRGVIRVHIAMEGDSLVVKVSDDGVGMEPAKVQALLEAIGQETEEAKRHGLSNVFYRLWLLYGKRVHIGVQSEVGEGTEILIRIQMELSMETGVQSYD